VQGSNEAYNLATPSGAGTLLLSGLATFAVGLAGCAIFLDQAAANGLPAAAAIAVLGAGTVLALIGVQLVIKAPSVPASARQLLVGSMMRSVAVLVMIAAALALLFGSSAFDLARVVGQAFPVVVAIDLVAYLSVLQSRLLRTRQ